MSEPTSDLRAKAELVSALAGADDKSADALTRLMAQMRAGTAGKADYQLAQDAFDGAMGITRPRGVVRIWRAMYEATVIPVCDFLADLPRNVWWHCYRKWRGGTVLLVRHLGGDLVRLEQVTWREWRRLHREEAHR